MEENGIEEGWLDGNNKVSDNDVILTGWKKRISWLYWFFFFFYDYDFKFMYGVYKIFFFDAMNFESMII